METAVWRGYYDCARRILELYVSGKGMALIAKAMSKEGWAFRTRYGQPSPLETPDVVRVTRNWIEYGGTVIGRRAKDRPAYAINPDEIPLNPERAVFDIDLLRWVGQVATERSYKKPDRGHNVPVRIYPLVGLLYCAQCDQVALQQNNLKLRSTLSGKTNNITNRSSYRHRPGLQCGCSRKQVSSAEIESDFLHLCQLLTVDEHMLTAMQNLAVQFLADDVESERVLMEQKAIAIAKSERRLVAARHLFEDGEICRKEYLRRKAKLERDLAYWQNYTTETEKLNAQLAMCVDAVTKISVLWANSTNEHRRGLAHNVFEEIVYNFDTQQIVSFKLKAWADQFIVLRGTLYEVGNEGYGCTPDALTYVTDKRGWELSTVKAARIGYMPQDKRPLLADLNLSDHWRTVIQKFPPNMIVYIHKQQGRLSYLSGRSIEGKQHYNPPRNIIGERQPYYNHLYRPQAEQVVIVEGQADAITFAEWGIPAVAINGMQAADELLKRLKAHPRLFVALDNTDDARAKSRSLALTLKGETYLPALPGEVKDVNEWLQRGASAEDALTLLNNSESWLAVEVNYAANLEGLERQDAIRELFTCASGLQFRAGRVQKPDGEDWGERTQL